MERFRKTICILCVFTMVFSYAACGKKKGDVDFSGDNNSKVVAPTNSTTNTSSEISSEDKELNDAWGNVSISVDTDSVTSKPASSKPSSSKPDTSKPAATTSQSATTSSSATSSVTSQSGSTVTSSQQATSSQATSSKGTTSYTDDDPAFGDWVKPGM